MNHGQITNSGSKIRKMSYRNITSINDLDEVRKQLIHLRNFNFKMQHIEKNKIVIEHFNA